MKLLPAYSQRVTMTCAECGNPLDVLERGKECPGCKMWPLCDDCANIGRHATFPHVPEEYEPRHQPRPRRKEKPK